jgi:hypothetical protein
MHACVNRTYSSKARKSPEPGPVVITAGNHLAILCLVFGAAFATFASGSFEQRIGNFLSFGLIPAVGLYAGAHLLGQLLIFGVELCDMIIARCSRYAMALAKRSLALGRHAYLELVDRRQPDKAILAELKPRNPFRSQPPDSAVREDDLHIKFERPNPPGSEVPMATHFGRDVHRNGWVWPLIITGVLLIAGGFGWLGASASYWASESQREEPTDAAAIHAIVEQIIRAESNGDSNAKNRRSTATGLGQFLDETWLDMIRVHRPDLAKARSQAEILELRRDAKIAREITARFAERNAEVLKRRDLPVTAETLYLAHFAGAAGAVAILSATENADAALVMATADATGRTKREKIVKANPFLERFTVADLRNWADRKMQVPGF